MEPPPLPSPTQVASARTPDQVPDHSGQPRRVPVEFFAPPPPEIGTLVSADSTLAKGRTPMSPATRWLIAAIVGGVPLLLMLWLASTMTRSAKADRTFVRVVGVVVGLGLFLLVMLLTRFKAVCTYVGEKGAARFSVKGSPSARPRYELLVFSQASEVHTKQTRVIRNGSYSGTFYDYWWAGPQGRMLFRLNGRHTGNQGPPRQGDPWHFAHAAEVGFTSQYLDTVQQQLQTEGSIPFRVDHARWLRVGPGFLEFHFGGEPARVNRDDIASVSLDNGQFSFKHKDAKWYSSQGKYSFAYGQMANAKVFLLALDKLLGYRWG